MSKASREQAEANRERVVATAARLFREKGFDGIGIADLMKRAGLTQGGFYANFSSKEQLMAEACGKAADDLAGAWREVADQAPKRNLSVIASYYLSQEHLKAPGNGCFAATLGPAAAQQGPLVRSTFTTGVKRAMDFLTHLIPSRSQKSRRREAIASFAAMVGGIVLARGVDDEAFADEILESVRAHIAGTDKALAT
jgi:TetR/AcrR family transcriptional regulator, transcriptional repressor for nem operon